MASQISSEPMQSRKPWLLPLITLIVLAAALIVILLLARGDGPQLTLDLGNGTRIELVRIGPGEFEMGTADSDASFDPSEGPRHKVKIARPFYMGKFEVTQAQWQAILNDNQSQLKGDPNLPADSISYGDCLKFCEYASQKTHRHFRLPTEAEWEYACRAGSTTPFNTGQALTLDQANIKGDTPEAPGKGKTVPVGSYKPNAFGLYDMHGNVWEWCQDVFRDSYEKAPADGSAVSTDKPADDTAYVYRGGSWKNAAAESRSAIRFASQKDLRTENVGFRVVVDVK